MKEERLYPLTARLRESLLWVSGACALLCVAVIYEYLDEFLLSFWAIKAAMARGDIPAAEPLLFAAAAAGSVVFLAISAAGFFRLLRLSRLR